MIADDDDLMRAGLVELLSGEPEMVGVASTGRQAVERALLLTPDVVLMDVRMPDLDGIAATRELARAAPAVSVLVLTTFEQDDYVFGALQAGASGFLLKRARPEQLIDAVHTIAGGESLLSPSVTRRVIDRMVQQPTATLADQTKIDELTPRARGPGADRSRPIEPGDRRSAHGRGVDRQEPCQADPDEARPARPRASRHLRL